MTDSIRHMLLRPALLALAAFATVLVAPSAVSAVTLGSTRVSETSNAGMFCGGFPSCADVQTALPGHVTRAPFDGTIMAWKVHLLDPGSLQLLILRKQGNGEFKSIRVSGVKDPATDGVKSFKAHLKVRRGDLVALNLLDEDVNVQILDTTGARVKAFNPAFQIGASQLPYAPFSSDLTELQFNAKLKR